MITRMYNTCQWDCGKNERPIHHITEYCRHFAKMKAAWRIGNPQNVI